MKMDFLKTLGSRLLFVDGGLGTMLQSMGLIGGQPPGSWNLMHPDRVRKVHETYLAAGCDIISANTFGADALHFGGQSLQVVRAGVSLVKEAVQNAGRGIVALDLGPTGKLLQPFGDLPFETAVTLFGDMADAGAQAGADVIFIETMSDSYEIKAAVLGCRERTNLPIVVTMMVNENEKLLTGGDIPGMVAMLEGLGVTALGLNCGLGPKQMLPLLKKMMACTSLPVQVCPNAGLPHLENGKTHFLLSPDAFAEEMEALVQLGPWLLGGCCGTTPDHMAAMILRLKDVKPKPISPKEDSVVCSYGKTVIFGDLPVLIGERINPTGKPRLKQALKDGDMAYLQQEAALQQESGAHMLDVNVGLPGIDEPAVLAQAVESLQAVTELPLQIDTADSTALEHALRAYNGKALVNSVTGKAASMAAVFPLIKKYGGAVVALPLDESGIPPSAEGRIIIARKILEEAQRYGIPKKDILLDGLTMTVSTDKNAALVTIDTIRRAKQELGLKTILGVSNVSFGLPRREKLNAAFFAMALAAGLDAAIMNPHSAPMIEAYLASAAIAGRDDQFQNYISAFGGQEATSAPAALKGEPSLMEAVLKGLSAQAGQAAQAMLEGGRAPLSLVEEELIPALSKVGSGFETGKLFLPQLLMSAEAAKAAFDKIRAALSASGQETKSRGKILLATVEGDIHDIGKNIVKVLLENYGFHVIDLGRDVPAETVVVTAIREDIPLVGLSALMTTTVPGMEKTIRLLRERKPGTFVMVGGAVLTEDYAHQIGADFYGKDAMASVNYAMQLFS
jgi:5-methyltetrahydrofolate--homocysteine methyltransferase